MRDVSYLFYVPDIFRLNREALGLLSNDGNFRQLSLKELQEVNSTIVTFEISLLLDDIFSAKLDCPFCLIDVSDALRACSGRSREDGGEKYWSFWKIVKGYFRATHEYESVRAAFHHKTELSCGDEMSSLLRAGCHSLRALWTDVLNELQRAGEAERFFQIEVPVRQIFSYRHIKGVRVSGQTIQSRIDSAKKEKYVAYRAIAEEIKVSPTGLTYRNVWKYLSGTDASHLIGDAESSPVDGYFKIAQHKSKFAKNFVSLIDAGVDVEILSRLLDKDGVVHPYFSTFGTVTSRILTTNPSLQQLRRRFRDVICAESGKRLAYLDYAQFEPGILASLSKNAELIAAYNNSDVYSALSEQLFGDSEHRAICKKIYLAFCYGMPVERISLLLSGADASPEELGDARQRVSRFFEKLPGLVEFKKSLEERLFIDGYVSSVFGNKRYRVLTGPLSAKERRWAVSQVIQGTASLIFKDALISLKDRFGVGAIILPMHDAVLMQFDPASWSSNVSEAIAIMEKAFVARCEMVRPKVVVSSFSE